jgi:hypothetical protein
VIQSRPALCRACSPDHAVVSLPWWATSHVFGRPSRVPWFIYVACRICSHKKPDQLDRRCSSWAHRTQHAACTYTSHSSCSQSFFLAIFL